MPTWSPEAWNSLGVVGLVLIVGFGMFLSLIRGWVVLGIYHREIVAGKDAVISDQRERSKIDAETMRSQAAVIAERPATEDVNIKLLQAFRKVASGEQE